MTNKILVTGGAGFIGSHLCDRLIKMGEDVLCVDNYFTGTKMNVAHLMKHPLFELMRHDVTFPLYVEVKRIFNLACPASPVHYQFDPGADDEDQRARRDQHAGPGQAREGAHPAGVHLARCTAIPRCIRSPKTTGARVNPIGIRSCYDEGKRCAETLFFDYHRQHQLDIKVIRIFNTYGPRMHPNDGRVVSNFIVQALRGEDITIYGDGQQTRSLLLRRRPGRRHAAHDGHRDGLHRPDQPRQPRRVHDARARREGDPAGRLQDASSCTSRFRRTTRSSASPTSRSRSRSSTGRRRSSSKTA